MTGDELKTQLETARNGGGHFPPTRIGAADNSQSPESAVCCSCKQLVSDFRKGFVPFSN